MENKFSTRLRHLRIEKNMTQKELALILDKSESTIRMWELGKNQADYDMLIQLASYFNCSTDYLLGIAEFKDKQDFEKTNHLLGELAETLDKIDGQIQPTIISLLNQLAKAYAKESSIRHAGSFFMSNFKITISSLIKMLDDVVELNESLVEGTIKDIEFRRFLSLVNNKEMIEKEINRVYYRLLRTLENKVSKED